MAVALPYLRPARRSSLPPPRSRSPTRPSQAIRSAISTRRYSTRCSAAGAFTVSVAVALNGHIVHTQAFGAANPYTGEAATTSSRFRIASISKTLLAIATMRLVQDGKLGLDDPVGGRLLSDLGVAPGDPAIAGITLRQLLSHTSGFPEYQRTFFGGGVPTCRDAAKRSLARGLAGPPGTMYQYSNLNFCLIGLLVQDVTGDTYEQVVKDEVLTPLGITDMRVAGTYDTKPGDVVHPTEAGRTFMETLGAAGSWVGTPADLVTVINSLDPTTPEPHLLPPDVAASMTQPAAVAYPHTDSWYGLGLIVWDSGASWGHTGTVENARSMVFHGPNGVSWAVCVNGNVPSSTPDLRKYVDKALATVPSWPALPAGPS